MTITRSSAEVRADLAAVALDFNQARADAAQYERLKKAPGEVPKLQARAGILTEELNASLDAEAKAVKDAAYSRIRNFSVDARPSQHGSGVLSCGFLISYEQLTYDMWRKESVWQSTTCNGFSSLQNDCLDYLIERQPEAIPTQITNLASGNPREAFGVYFRGLRRGHLTS